MGFNHLCFTFFGITSTLQSLPPISKFHAAEEIIRADDVCMRISPRFAGHCHRLTLPPSDTDGADDDDDDDVTISVQGPQ